MDPPYSTAALAFVGKPEITATDATAAPTKFRRVAMLDSPKIAALTLSARGTLNAKDASLQTRATISPAHKFLRLAIVSTCHLVECLYVTLLLYCFSRYERSLIFSFVAGQVRSNVRVSHSCFPSQTRPSVAGWEPKTKNIESDEFPIFPQLVACRTPTVDWHIPSSNYYAIFY